MQRWIRRILGVLQVGGGFLGLVLIGQALGKSPSLLSILFLTTLFAVAYFLGILSGVGLLEGRARAVEASMGFWVLQLLTISSPIFSYELWAGLASSLVMNFSSLGLGWNFHFGSNFQLFFLRSGAPFSVGINLIACAALYLLHRFENELQGPSDRPLQSIELPATVSVE